MRSCIPREVIANRLPAVAGAMGIESGFDEWLTLYRCGKGIDLLKLESYIQSIEPGRYSLVILMLGIAGPWLLGERQRPSYGALQPHRRLPSPGAAWVNVHHASKGDQSGNSITDVGSGAGSQSLAADTHLIIRPHQDENVAVVEAVVQLASRGTIPSDGNTRRGNSTRKRTRGGCGRRVNAGRMAGALRLDEDRQAVGQPTG